MGEGLQDLEGMSTMQCRIQELDVGAYRGGTWLTSW